MTDTMPKPAQERGCHVVTPALLRHLPELKEFKVGLAVSGGWDLRHCVGCACH